MITATPYFSAHRTDGTTNGDSDGTDIDRQSPEPWGGIMSRTLEVQALRTVLAATLTQEQAAALVGDSLSAAVNRWPSSVFDLVARTAFHSHAVWQRCEYVIEAALARVSAQPAKPCRLALRDIDGSVEIMTWTELAASLWAAIKDGRALSPVEVTRMRTLSAVS